MKAQEMRAWSIQIASAVALEPDVGSPNTRANKRPTGDAAWWPRFSEPAMRIPSRKNPDRTTSSSAATPLFTNNETNATRVWGEAAQNTSPWVKDAFHRHIIHGEETVNPALRGTKAGLHFAALQVPAGGSVVVRLRFTDGTPVEAYFLVKGPAKSTLAVQHRQLASREEAARLRTYWAERLAAIGALLAEGR